MVEAAQQDLNQVFSDLINRIRDIESKYNLLGERLLVVNQNLITHFKKVQSEVRALNGEIKEINSELFKTKEVIKDIAKEMQFFATKEELKTLEKYINLWNPMKFVSEEKVEKIIEEKLKNAKSKKRSGR